MKIVTGYKGTPHISSNDQQAFNQGIFGGGNSVLDIGNRFAATLTNVNTVTVSDGEGVIQGVHFRIEPGETETVNIANGAVGSYRLDLICARYTKDPATGVENISLVLLQGMPDESDPQLPDYNTGNILEGATIVDYPLYLVQVNEITPVLKRRYIPSCALSQSAKHTLTPTDGSPGLGGCFYYKTLCTMVVRVCVTGLTSGTSYNGIVTVPYAPEYSVSAVCEYGSINVDDEGNVNIIPNTTDFIGEIRFDLFS